MDSVDLALAIYRHHHPVVNVTDKHDLMLLGCARDIYKDVAYRLDKSFDLSRVDTGECDFAGGMQDIMRILITHFPHPGGSPQ